MYKEACEGIVPPGCLWQRRTPSKVGSPTPQCVTVFSGAGTGYLKLVSPKQSEKDESGHELSCLC